MKRTKENLIKWIYQKIKTSKRRPESAGQQKGSRLLQQNYGRIIEICH